MIPHNPVLLVHGIFDTAALFTRMAAFLQSQGRTAYALNLVPNNGGAGLNTLAEQLAAFVAIRFPAPQPIDLVGFSMGGLVSRYYVQRLGGIERVQRLVTIGCPNHGTYMAYLHTGPGAKQMLPGSQFVRDLNRDAGMLEGISFTSIWTPLDLMILPARSSEMPVGRSIRVRVAAHPLMVRNRKVMQLVLAALNDGECAPVTG